MAAAKCKIKDLQKNVFSLFDVLYLLALHLQNWNRFSPNSQTKFFISVQPDDDDEDDEDDEDEGEGLYVSTSISVNLANSLSFSFLLPVQTDLWAGLNCHVTFFVTDCCSSSAAGFAAVVTGSISVGSTGVATMLVVTFPNLPMSSCSCSVKSSLSTSGSVASPNASQSGSTGSRFGRATPADLLPAPETLEE